MCSRDRVLLAAGLLLWGCSGSQPGAAAVAPQPADCIDFKTAVNEQGEPIDCYPLRCRDGACLTRCESPADCAGSLGPATLAEEGWPLDCHGGRCVPLPPDAVE